ncbi:MAG: hypothetical protein EHM89_00235 [Acidobacteria bacterium]|nr:MAG: hypothetical protein EHM89_00235 [Acidobacteriota bacterium]
MDPQKLVDELKKYGPTAGIAIVTAIVAANLAIPDSPTGKELPALPPEVQREVHARKDPGNRIVTRLVSCGDSTQATIVGDDLVGIVTPGDGASGSCTLLFSNPWQVPPTCAANGGDVASATTTDLVFTNIGEAVAYRCDETPEAP